MPNKTEKYLAHACKTADSFSRQWEHWAEFLITAARLYKYSYPDQLMIYAQRPDATACAEYDVFIRHSLTENSGQKRLPKNMHRTVPVDVRTPIWTEAVVGSTTTARG